MFLRKNKIVLDCYTSLSAAANLFPISYSKKHRLNWMPQVTKGVATISGCPGIRDYVSTGFVLPLWTDVKITASENVLNSKVEVADRDVNRFRFIMPGSTGQFFSEKPVAHLKIVPPWFFRCTEDISFSFSGAFYHINNPNLIVCPGLVNYTHQLTPTIQTYINLCGNQVSIDLQAGTPLAHIIPLTDREVHINVHHVSDEAFLKLGLEENEMKAFFSFGYYKRKAIKKVRK
jgi:hypothetical protein